MKTMKKRVFASIAAVALAGVALAGCYGGGGGHDGCPTVYKCSKSV